jgi:acyl-coenzyme A synthetase/AMP-(fatty) acid ligase
MIFDIRSEGPETDIYWCAADIGWVTGHSYIVYGPLANATTSIVYEGAPDFPDKDRWWSMVEKYRATILYTAPTAIRTFQAATSRTTFRNTAQTSTSPATAPSTTKTATSGSSAASMT